MANELMKIEYESMSGMTVQLDAQTVRSMLTKGNGKIKDEEVAVFLRTCAAKKLDPFESGQIHLIKYGDANPAQIVEGYHSFVRRADKHPDYRGFKAGITVIRPKNDEPVLKEGCCVYKQLGEVLIGGWCRVYKESANGYMEEFFSEVSLDEYSTGKSNWSAKPATMIRKCAIAQAMRMAFPNDYEGIYTAEEAQMSGIIPGDYKVVDETGEAVKVAPSDDDTVITQEQRKTMVDMAQSAFGKREGNRLLIEFIKAEGFESSYDMTVAAWKRVCKKVMDESSKTAVDAEFTEAEDKPTEAAELYSTDADDVADFLKD